MLAAEDAFQAVFLVPANRARSIRASGSIASWLFGVAQRVASRGKRSAARRQALHRLVAERTSEGCLPAENDPDWEILHEEVDGLPERLRAPIVLCHLQGLTYAAAAQQLGLSETALRGQLARARERLRQRLTRRGVTVPAGLLIVGAAGQAQAAVPTTLIHSTFRVAFGFLAGNTAAVLARSVLHSMLLDRLRIAAILLGLGLGGSYWAWQALAAAVDGKGRAHPAQAVVQATALPQPARTDRYVDPLPPGAAMRLGTVRFRQSPKIDHVVYSPDGRLVATDSQGDDLQVWDARDGRKLRRIDAGVEQVHDFAWSPDGRLIAVVGFGLVPERNLVLPQLTILDVASGRPVRRGVWDWLSGEDELAFAPDGKTVATDSNDGTPRLWDVATAKLLHPERLGDGRNVASIAFSPDAASHLLAIASDRVIHLWDAAHHRMVRKIAIAGEHDHSVGGGDRRPTGLAFSPDGTSLAAGIRIAGAEIQLWRVGDGTLVRHFRSPRRTSVNSLYFSPDGKRLAAEGFGGPPVLFDAESGKELESFEKEFDLVEEAFQGDSPMAFSPDGRTLAAIGGRQALHFWDLTTGKDRLATPEAHLGVVCALAFPADGRVLFSGSTDRTVRIWDLATGRPTRTIPHDGWVWSLAVSTDGSFLAAGVAGPMEVLLWDLRTGERLHSWPIEGDSSDSVKLREVTLRGDGSSVIVALANGSLRCWDLSTGKERVIAQPNPPKPLDPDLAAYSRDGRSKVIVRWVPGREIKLADGNVRYDPATPASTIVWLDTETGHVRREIEIPQADVTRLALSPDDRSLAVGYVSTLDTPARGFIRIVRLRDKREIQTIESPCAGINALGFTPDGKQIVAGLRDTSIVIWDIRPTD
jgi:RNA polymerase sigma factor (sigma-70 family)